MPHDRTPAPTSERLPAENTPLEQDEERFRIAEFTSLRDEIRSRSESQHQLVTLAVLATGALFALGLQGPSDAAIPALLAYLILAAFLATLWGQHDVRVGQIGVYIRDHVEPRVPHRG